MDYANQACKAYLKNATLSAEMGTEALQTELNRFWDSILIQVSQSTGNTHIRNAYQLMVGQARCQVDTLNWLDVPEVFYSTIAKGGKKKLPWPGLTAALLLLVMVFWLATPLNKGRNLVCAWILGAALVLLLAQLLLTFLTAPVSPVNKVRAEQRISPNRVRSGLQRLACQVDSAADTMVAILTEEDIGTTGVDLSLIRDLLRLPADQRSGAMVEAVDRYLVRLGVEKVEYSENTRDLFMTLPSSRDMTVEPALVKDGQVLQLGVACVAGEV